MRRILTAFLLAGPLLGQLQEISRAYLSYPTIYGQNSSIITCILNDVAANDMCAMVFHMSATGNVTDVGWRTGTVTSSQSLTIRLETVDSGTGLPTGTLYHANATATRASLVANTEYSETFTAFGANKGDLVALVFQFTDTAGNLQVVYGANLSHYIYWGYGITKDAGAWGSKSARSHWASITVDGVERPLGHPGFADGYITTSTNYNSGSTQNEYGIRIASSAYTGRAAAIYWYAATTCAAGSAYSGRIYDSTGTEIGATAVYNCAETSASAARFTMPLLTPVVIVRGMQYDVTMRAENSSNITTARMNFGSQARMAVMAEYGDGIYQVTKGSGGTTDRAYRPAVLLLLDAIYVGSGGFVVTQ
ncbi:MAG: hypothetical protein NTZ98_07745 [Acidobacteria bacterium]|nr:hypothetical protein [Acidobacteriota bacterium]